SMAQTRSKTCSNSWSGISSGALFFRAIDPPPQAVQVDKADARGPSQGTETLTGVLVATVRDPSGSGPSVRLVNGFHFHGAFDVTSIHRGTKPPTVPIVTGSNAHAQRDPSPPPSATRPQVSRPA